MGSKQALTKIQSLMKKLSESGGFDKVMRKINVTSAGNGKCTAEFTVEKEHTNSYGTVHGGCFAAVVDMISTFAVMTSKREAPGVSVDMHITYMSAAKLGEEVLIEANTIRAGKTLAFLDVVIKNKSNGKIYCTGKHTKFVA